MNNHLQQLILLQEADLEINEIKRHLQQIPKQIEASRLKAEEGRKDLTAAEEEIKVLQKKRMLMEQEVQRENDHMVKSKEKLLGVKTNKEYSALLGEIDTAKNKIAILEDGELEVMESLEEMEQKVPGLKADFNENEQEFQEYKKKKEAEAARMKEELETKMNVRADICASIEPKWVKHYDKVVNLRGEQAVVWLKTDSCPGCNQTLLPQMVIEVKVGKEIQQCQHCNRILYWKEQPETETAVPK